MKRLPEATFTGHASQSLAFTASATDHPKGCLHTTEGGDWPPYQNWTVAPHLTVKPIPRKGVDVRQHVEFDAAAFALRNLSGGVQTNKERVYQIELVGTCSKAEADKHGLYFWPDADDAVLLDLGRKVIVPMSRPIADGGLGIPLRALRFQAYDASYGPRGNTNTVRLSGSAWEDYAGWLGHQHAPENVHGDPGAFPWERMMRLLEDDDMTPAEVQAACKAALVAHSKEKVLLNDADTKLSKFSRDGILTNTETDVDLLKGLTREAIAAADAARAAAVAAKTAAEQASAAAKVGGIDYAALAKAVNDDAAARLKQ